MGSAEFSKLTVLWTLLVRLNRIFMEKKFSKLTDCRNREATLNLGSELGYIQIWNMDYEVKGSF